MELPSWVPGDEVKPAPLPLLLVQAFVNTWEGDSGFDLLADASAARPWLADTGLLTGTAALDATATLPPLVTCVKASAPFLSTMPAGRLRPRPSWSRCSKSGGLTGLLSRSGPMARPSSR